MKYSPDPRLRGEDRGCAPRDKNYKSRYALPMQNAAHIFGIDEVGRGPLAGPVMAACVYIPPTARALPFWDAVTDSKKLTAKKRDTLFAEITKHCPYGIGEVSAQEIDRLNIHHATLRAMQLAFDACPHEPVQGNALILIDGKFTPPDLPFPAKAVIKGDVKHVEIAAASIIAKVTRDRLMQKLHAAHPHYGWDSNAGYGTKAHMAGIAEFGITPHHRKSFAPCTNAKMAA